MSEVIHVDFRARRRTQPIVPFEPTFSWEQTTDIDEALAAACRRHIDDVSALLDEQVALYGRILP